MVRKSPPQTLPQARWLTKRLAVVAILVGMIVLAGGLVFADWYTSLPEGTTATYVGRQSCIQCHQQEAKLYAGSHHDLAMDQATEKTVLGDFNDAEFTHFGITSRMYRDGQRFMIHTEGPDGQMADFEVKYVLGVSPLQNYMVEFERDPGMPEGAIGRLQVLRISWNSVDNHWFYLPPPDVHDKLDPEDDLHWTGIAQRWNTMCADCHSTNVQKNFSTETLRYQTTFSEIDVSCEACHGPGSTHVQLATSYSLFWDRKLGYGLPKLKTASNEPQVQMCAECHARREVLADGYDPGDNYWDHYSTELLGRLTYHADGQIEDEVFEHGSYLQSKMYHKGVRCTDCHDPHSARPKYEGNKLCTSCHQHPAGKYDTPLHYHHEAGGQGASCVACHMPQTTYMEFHGRHDHSLRVPRPDLSVALGTPNACTGCHLDQQKLKDEVEVAGGTTNVAPLKQYLHFVQAARQGDETIQAELRRLDQWSADAVEKWYGAERELKKEPRHFAYALAAARQSDPQAEKLLAEVVRNRHWPAIVRATALTEWAQYGSEAMFKASTGSLKDRDPLVRSAAAQNLMAAPPEQRAKALAPLLEDPDFAVRRIAARALADCTSLLRGSDRSTVQQTLNAWVDGLMFNNDRGGAHLAVGSLFEQLGDPASAERAYRRALRVEPRLFGPRGNLAALMEDELQSGQLPPEQASALVEEIGRLRKEELALLERDVGLAPHNAPLQYRYGLALYLQGEHEKALAALGKAVELEPRSSMFRMAYALLLQRLERYAEAIEQVELILEQRPEDREAQQLLAQLKRQVADE